MVIAEQVANAPVDERAGPERWRLRTGGATESSPALDGQRMIYLAVNQLQIGVSKNGKKIWEHPAGDFIDASPAVAENRVIYFPAPQRDLIATDPDGNEVWRITLDWITKSSPLVGTDGTVYVSEGQSLSALTSTNQQPLAKSPWPMWRANPQHTGRVQIVK